MRCLAKTRTLFLLYLAIGLGAAEVHGRDPSDATFFVVRHAERRLEGDGLTEAGKRRAEALRDILKELRLSAVYSTDATRARETALPTAEALQLEIQPYGDLAPQWFEQLKTRHRGQSALIVGHSPTVERIVHGLGGRGQFSVGSDYDNLFIVAVRGDATTVVRLRYGTGAGTALARAVGDRDDLLTRFIASEAKKKYRFYRIDYEVDSSRQAVFDSGLDVLEETPGIKSMIVRAADSYMKDLRARGLPGDLQIHAKPDLDRAFEAEVAALQQRETLADDPAGKYHTYAEVNAVLRRLADTSPHARMFNIGQSVLGNDIWAIEIGRGKQAEAVVVGCHHAREWISVEVPLELARLLADPDRQGDDGPRIQRLLESARITIVPMLNPDGHDFSVSHSRLWRKNLADNGSGSFGVDLNRNYATRWGGPGASSDPRAGTYHGPTPFSEPETRAFRQLLEQRAELARLKGVLSFHSYSQLVLFPWGSPPQTPDPAELEKRKELKELADLYAASVFAVHAERYTPQQASQLYVASGIMGDWIWDSRTQTVQTLTVELRPRYAFPGFILPDSMIAPTWEENRPAILAVLERWLLPETALETATVEGPGRLPALESQIEQLRRTLDEQAERLRRLEQLSEER